MNELRAKDYAVAAKPGSTSLEPASPSHNAAGDFLGVLWRRKWLIGAIVLGCLALGVFWAKTVTPRYTATATVKLDVYQPGIADIETVVTGLTGDTREVRSQLQVIRSRSLLGRVVDAMDLTKDPEFNPFLTPKEDPSVFSMSYVLGLVFGSPGPSAGPSEIEVRERAIDALAGRTNVLPVHFSFVFGVAVQTTDPQKSADIANMIAEQYILNQIEVKYRATEQAAGWLSNRVSELKVALEDAEAAVAIHRAQNELVGEEAVEQLSQRLISLRSTLSDVTKSRNEAVSRLAQIEALAAQQDLAGLAALTGSIRLENLAKTIAGNGGPEAAANAAAVARFELELKAVRDRLGREVTQSESSMVKLGQSIADLEVRQDKQGADLVLLRQLEREAEAASVIYETFLSRLKETSVQQGVHKADAIVISEARVPRARSFPRYRIVLGAALLIGLLIASIIVAILETLDQTFSTPDELERFTGLPVLGLIPSAPITARGNILKFAMARPTSPFMEAVRNLRTSVQLSGVDGDVQVIALASAAEGEGKTTLTMSLAHSSATQANKKVLVMDCDLRRRRLTSELGGKGLPGIIAYFSGSKTIDDIIHPMDNGAFDIVFADKSPKITADIFASQKFERLMTELRKRYDLVIIDTPPVLALTDVRVIANYVDMLLFSVSWKRTRRKLVRAAMAALAMTKPKRIATVMNRMNIGKSIGYYGSYYYN